MRESMARLTPLFSAQRTVREYTEHHYLPAAAAYAQRTADSGRLGADIASWHATVAWHWGGVHFGDVKVDNQDGQLHFEVPVYVGEIDPNFLRVELFAMPQQNGQDMFRQEMERGAQLADHGYLYSTRTPATRHAADFTPRVIPHHEGASVPLEGSQILWHK
jgi:starch phosphorylase